MFNAKNQKPQSKSKKSSSKQGRKRKKAPASEVDQIMESLWGNWDREQVQSCLAVLKKDDLLRGAKDIKQAQEMVIWHMLLYLDRSSWDPGLLERLTEIRETEYRKSRPKVEQILKHLTGIQKLASELFYTRESFYKSDGNIPGEFAHIATLLMRVSEVLQGRLLNVFAYMKMHYGKEGGRKKKAEQIFLHFLVHDVMKYCGITLYEASNRIEWFLPKWSGWRQGLEENKRKIGFKRIQQCHKLMREID